jgi:DNA-binding response OmpR family regulator
MTLCPCCGGFAARMKPIAIGPFLFDPQGDLLFDGRGIGLTTAEHRIVGALMAAAPAIIDHRALLDHADSTARPKIIDVRVCHIRRKLRQAGAPFSLLTVRGRGFRWDTSCEEVLRHAA